MMPGKLIYRGPQAAMGERLRHGEAEIPIIRTSVPENRNLRTENTAPQPEYEGRVSCPQGFPSLHCARM